MAVCGNAWHWFYAISLKLALVQQTTKVGRRVPYANSINSAQGCVRMAVVVVTSALTDGSLRDGRHSHIVSAPVIIAVNYTIHVSLDTLSYSFFFLLVLSNSRVSIAA